MTVPRIKSGLFRVSADIYRAQGDDIANDVTDTTYSRRQKPELQ